MEQQLLECTALHCTRTNGRASDSSGQPDPNDPIARALVEWARGEWLVSRRAAMTVVARAPHTERRRTNAPPADVSCCCCCFYFWRRSGNLSALTRSAVRAALYTVRTTATRHAAQCRAVHYSTCDWSTALLCCAVLCCRTAAAQLCTALHCTAAAARSPINGWPTAAQRIIQPMSARAIYASSTLQLQLQCI